MLANVLPDTNAEENAPVQQPSSVLKAVSRAILVEGPKDFFGSFFAFFRRYFCHYRDAFRFFSRPSVKVAPFNSKDIRENSQHAFEVALLFTAALIFMIKQNWIPVNKELQEQYGNDFVQMFFELVIFFIFAAAYFVQLLLSVLAGRLVRLLFQVPVTRNESDVLFCYLNNAFFSLSAFMAFCFRCSMQFDQISGTSTETGIYGFSFLLSFCLVALWSFNFARLNHLSVVRRLFFFVFAILLFTVLYGLGMSAICLFVIGS